MFVQRSMWQHVPRIQFYHTVRKSLVSQFSTWISHLQQQQQVQSIPSKPQQEFWKPKEEEQNEVSDNLVQFAMNNDFHFLEKIEGPMLMDQKQYIFIDVRSPKEYSKDHIPNSINLPVLNNQEREIVGAEYAECRHRGKLIGAQLICKNINNILESSSNTLFKKEHRKINFVIYCSRGQQRSQSLATILSKIGFRVFVVQGGYKHWRKQVMEELELFCSKFKQQPNKIIKIQSKTGCGKSLLLETLVKRDEKGLFVLDIEKAARHFGSILGEYPAQYDQTDSAINYTQNEYFQYTNQRQFETNLYYQILKQQHLWNQEGQNILFLESESNRIGSNTVPYPLLQCIKSEYNAIATIHASIESRVQYIRQNYKHFEEGTIYKKILIEKLDILKKSASHLSESIEIWKKWIEENQNWHEFVTELLNKHYDLVYSKSHNATNRNPKHDSIPNISLSIEKSISEEEMKILAGYLIQQVRNL